MTKEQIWKTYRVIEADLAASIRQALSEADERDKILSADQLVNLMLLALIEIKVSLTHIGTFSEVEKAKLLNEAHEAVQYELVKRLSEKKKE